MAKTPKVSKKKVESKSAFKETHSPVTSPWAGGPEVVQAKKRIGAILEKLSITDLIEETMRLQSERSTRTLKASDVIASTQMKMTTAILENAAHRSRLVEIRMKAMRSHLQCEVVINALVRFLQNKFVLEVKEAASTKDERRALLTSGLVGENDLVDEVKQLLALTETAIDDLDKTAWSLKSIVELMTITHREPSTKGR